MPITPERAKEIILKFMSNPDVVDSVGNLLPAEGLTPPYCVRIPHTSKEFGKYSTWYDAQSGIEYKTLDKIKVHREWCCADYTQKCIEEGERYQFNHRYFNHSFLYIEYIRGAVREEDFAIFATIYFDTRRPDKTVLFDIRKPELSSDPYFLFYKDNKAYRKNGEEAQFAGKFYNKGLLSFVNDSTHPVMACHAQELYEFLGKPEEAKYIYWYDIAREIIQMYDRPVSDKAKERVAEAEKYAIPTASLEDNYREEFQKGCYSGQRCMTGVDFSVKDGKYVFHFSKSDNEGRGKPGKIDVYFEALMLIDERFNSRLFVKHKTGWEAAHASLENTLDYLFFSYFYRFDYKNIIKKIPKLAPYSDYFGKIYEQGGSVTQRNKEILLLIIFLLRNHVDFELFKLNPQLFSCGIITSTGDLKELFPETYKGTKTGSLLKETGIDDNNWKAIGKTIQPAFDMVGERVHLKFNNTDIGNVAPSNVEYLFKIAVDLFTKYPAPKAKEMLEFIVDVFKQYPSFACLGIFRKYGKYATFFREFTEDNDHYQIVYNRWKNEPEIFDKALYCSFRDSGYYSPDYMDQPESVLNTYINTEGLKP